MQFVTFQHMRRRKYFLIIDLSVVVATLLSVYFSDSIIEKAALGKVYTDTGSIPHNEVGLLLGTGKYLSTGTLNPYYRYRIEAAADLLKAGKIRYLVISGDNSRKDYNEPAYMQSDLIAEGIDTSRLFLDYAGFRTFDSVVRLKEIFGQDSATIISQPFHNERALYIASREGIHAVGYNAQDVGSRFGLKVQAREKLARVKVFIDYLFNEKPKYLGSRVTIP